MQQTAIFVDAGYLCMAGGTLVAQNPVNRRRVQLEIKPLLEALIKQAEAFSNGKPLLRIYWYDGCPGGTRKTAEHSLIEKQPDVKLRMGTINREGRQKGVDTMLVLDLVELAQNRAISDAVIVGGDEDLRGGIVRAQALGVRVHLLGIEGVGVSNSDPTLLPNQSPDMISEADRVHTWTLEDIAGCITVAPETATETTPLAAEPEYIHPGIIQAAEESARQANLRDVILYWDAFNNRGLPADIDGRLLASARGILGHNLSTEEKRALRAHHTQALIRRIQDEMPGQMHKEAILDEHSIPTADVQAGS